jgi:hypothetical protein
VVRSNQLGYFPIALYFGQPKHVNLQFLAEAIAELEVLFEQGIKIQSGQSRACYGFPYSLCKVIQSLSSYFGCEKCHAPGKYAYGKVIYTWVDQTCAAISLNVYGSLFCKNDYRVYFKVF